MGTHMGQYSRRKEVPVTASKQAWAGGGLLRGNPRCPHLDFRLLVSRTPRGCIPAVLSPRFMLLWYGNPRKLIHTPIYSQCPVGRTLLLNSSFYMFRCLSSQQWGVGSGESEDRTLFFYRGSRRERSIWPGWEMHISDINLCTVSFLITSSYAGSIPSPLHCCSEIIHIVSILLGHSWVNACILFTHKRSKPLPSSLSLSLPGPWGVLRPLRRALEFQWM